MNLNNSENGTRNEKRWTDGMDHLKPPAEATPESKAQPRRRSCGRVLIITLLILVLASGLAVVALYFAGVLKFSKGDTGEITTEWPSNSSLWTTDRVTGIISSSSNYVTHTSEGRPGPQHNFTTELSVSVTQLPDITTESYPRTTWWPFDSLTNRTRRTPTSVRCEHLDVDQCRTRLGYVSIGFPSLFNTNSQSQSYLALDTFQQIDARRCYPHTLDFACATLFPECRDGILIHPCKSFCQDFQKSCDWPIRCNSFPDDDHEGRCYPGPTGLTTGMPREDYTNPCQEGEFLCGNDVCVAETLVCDGEDSCGDFTDEIVSSNGSLCSRGDALDCDFEEGNFCRWYQDDTFKDQFDWVLSKAPSSLDTGPAFDHTHRQDTDSGFFALAEASGIYPLDKASLKSPMTTSSLPRCLRFYYHMFGENIDQLRVYLVYNANTDLIWQRRRNFGDVWKYGAAQLPLGTFSIAFEATRGDGFRADIALDDITVRPGICPKQGCADGEYPCANNHCLSRVYVCDRKDDCGDYSDERACNCTVEEFRCATGLCIPSYRRCDRAVDCPDLSDELNCECENGKYACDDGHCIPSEWLCDGELDCEKGDDEKNNCERCEAGFYRCRGGGCVTEDAICDGSPQCRDGSDEFHCLRLQEGDILQVRFSNMWIPLCADAVQKTDVQVLCEQMGKGGVVTYAMLVKDSVRYLALTKGLREDESALLGMEVSGNCTSNAVVSLVCSPSDCGVRSENLAAPMVIGGKDAGPGRWPWQATIYLDGRVTCGGSLLSESHVLTAAHCVSSHDLGRYRVVVGAVHAVFSYDSPNAQIRNVKRIDVHPQFDLLSYQHGYDVAIFVLQSPVDFTDFVRPICLPHHPPSLTALCYSAGLGYTSRFYNSDGQPGGILPERLQEVKLRLWSEQKCLRAYPYGNPRLICAGYRAGDPTTCVGDSGGPLMCDDGRGKWELAGVFSFIPKGCNVPEYPPVFGNVTVLLPWIRTSLECQFECSNGRCLWLKSEVCNGVDDCGDNSDEIRLCARNISCDFEDSYLCGYNSLEGQGVANKWWRLSGTAANNAGPIVDSNAPTNTGWYMFAGSNASLLTPMYNSSGALCLSLRYHMRARDPGTLRVLLSSGKARDDRTELLFVQGYQGDIWQYRALDLPAGNYRVEIEAASRGPNKTPVIAVDQLALSNGHCDQIECPDGYFSCGTRQICLPPQSRCNFQSGCLDESDESACQDKMPYTCNLENYNGCGLEQDVFDDYDWAIRRSDGRSTSLPPGDNTEGLNGQGYFAYLNMRYASAGESADMWLPVQSSTNVSCFSFYYNLHKKAILQVFSATKSTDSLLMWEARDESQGWRSVFLPLDVGVRLLKFKGLVGQTGSADTEGYVAIDDLSIRNQQCQNPACAPAEFQCQDGECIERYHQCDGIPDCSNGEDETPSLCLCYPDAFQCSNGRCVKGHTRCDGINNCLDHSDETQCQSRDDYFCEEDEFACQDGTCKNVFTWCDGHNDCADGTDEPPGCACAGDQFECSPGVCIPVYSYCDGVTNCRDGRDEPPTCRCNLDYQYQCSSGECIPATFRCDTKQHCKDASDEKNCSCTEDEFSCPAGMCLSRERYCDGKPDCPGAYDEPAGCECSTGQFHCAAGGCISNTYVCDLLFDCEDHSDEKNCTCYAGEFVCGNGVCILESKVCDGVDNCGDLSDEISCECGTTEWRCASGLCLTAGLRCDGDDNCGDESDEQGCGCRFEEWQCANSQCIPRDVRCDGYPDCDDRSDELNCGSCGASEYRCADFTCVPSVARCDGRANCPDGSDELFCVSVDVGQGELLTGFYSGEWLALCADNWNPLWADQICRQLDMGPPILNQTVTYHTNESYLITGERMTATFRHELLVPGLCSKPHAIRLVCGDLDCGVSGGSAAAPYIIGGDLAGSGDWPWVGALFYLGSYRCGAILIADRWLLSAAHCFFWDNGLSLAGLPYYFTVRLGSRQLTSNDPHAQVLSVRAITLHPNYTVGPLNYRWHDVALVELDGAVVGSEFVRPVCLPGGSGLPQTCYITGWGVTNRDWSGLGTEYLREARCKLWSAKECSSVDAWREKYEATSQLCGGFTSGVIAPCYGDSGGGVVCRDGAGHWRLEGVISVGPPDCGRRSNQPAKPTVFSRVASYHDWIQANLASGR